MVAAAVANPSEPRNAFIDVLRGVAILGVVFQHLFFWVVYVHTPVVPIAGTVVSTALFNNGWIGVNLFFVLSGFVLFQPGIASSRRTVLAYYVARAARLWPLLFIFVTFISIIEDRNLFTLGYYLLVYLSGFNSILSSQFLLSKISWVLWSLGVEILFSVVLPGLLAAIRRFTLVRVLIAVAIWSLVYRVVADQVWYASVPGWGNAYLNAYKDNIFGRIDDFMFGMAAAHLVRTGWAPGRALAWIAGATLIITLLGWNYAAAAGAPRTLPLSVVVSLLHTGFAASVMVLITAGIGLRIWSRPALLPLVICGQLAYSIYLFHAFFYRYTQPALTVSGVLVYLGMTFAAAMLSFIFIESAGIHRMPAWTRPFGVRR